MPPERRRPFYLYLDEFQTFTTQSLAAVVAVSVLRPASAPSSTSLVRPQNPTDRSRADPEPSRDRFHGRSRLADSRGVWSGLEPQVRDDPVPKVEQPLSPAHRRRKQLHVFRSERCPPGRLIQRRPSHQPREDDRVPEFSVARIACHVEVPSMEPGTTKNAEGWVFPSLPISGRSWRHRRPSHRSPGQDRPDHPVGVPPSRQPDQVLLRGAGDGVRRCRGTGPHLPRSPPHRCPQPGAGRRLAARPLCPPWPQSRAHWPPPTSLSCRGHRRSS